jgi:hypothetical protein
VSITRFLEWTGAIALASVIALIVALLFVYAIREIRK